jgi:hypothetical protein
MADKPKAVKKEKTQAEIESRAKQRAEKFVELGSKRTSKALVAIRNLGKLASPNYRYTPDQVVKIVSVLVKAVEDVQSRFTSAPKVEKPTFTL